MKINLNKIFIILLLSISSGLLYNHFNSNGLRLIREERKLSWEYESSLIKQKSTVDLQTKEDSIKETELRTEKSDKYETKDFKEPKAIKTPFAYKLFLSGVKFIDARPVEEYEEGHIKGAINIPFYGSENYENVLGIIPKDEVIVTYCNGDDCDLSILLGDEIFKKGYKKVYVYFGGWNDWLKLGYPIEKE